MSGRGIGLWGSLALIVLVASPVSRMIGDPVHFVWVIGAAAILCAFLALRSALRH